LTESNDASDLPARPITATPPIEPTASVAEIEEQHRMLREYAEQQEALRATREAEERDRLELQARQQQELEEQRRAQAESDRLAQEQLLQQVMTQIHDAAAQQQSQLEQQLLSLRGENERDQSLLEKHDQVRFSYVSSILGSFRLKGFSA
jgi:huntingtin-interacting protein 1-related protein